MSLTGYLPPLVAEIVADTKGWSAGLGKAEKDIGALEGSVKRLAGLGKVAFAALGVAAAGVAYESVKLAMNFDQTMELVHTQAGAAQSEVDGLKDKVLALAPAVGIGPEKLAEGLYHIESTGYRGQEALDILTASAKLAAIGMADLDDVTYAMSGTMSVGMKDIKDAADATSYLNQIVGMGDMRMDALARAIGTGVLPSFKSAGLGMTDFGAALATLTDNSVPADEAATRLRMTVALMSAPSGKAAGALHEIGLAATSLADDMRKPDGLLVAVMDLKTHLEASGKTASEQNAIIEQAFGGGRTSGAILTLLKETDRLKSKYEQMGTSATRAGKQQEAWAQQQKQFKQQLNELVAQLQAWGVKIGNFLIPKIQELVTWVNTHKEQAKVLAWIIGTVLVAAIALYVVSMAQAAVATIAATWPVLLIIAALAALGFGIYELVKHWDTAWGWIKKTAGEAWHWIYDNVWVPIRDTFIRPMVDYLKILKDAWSGNWTKMGRDLKDIYNHTIGPVLNAISGGIHDIEKAVGGVSGAASSAYSHTVGALPHFDQGGVMPGPIGAPGLAVVHGGETITPPGHGGGGGDIVIHQTLVTPDGEVLRRQTLRYARRAGLNPSDLYSDAAVQGSLVRS